MKSKQKTLVTASFIIIAILAAFGVYYNALSNGFIWDDPIVLERQVPAFLSAKDIFFPPAGIPEFGGNYYRPLVILSFIIDKAIWGNSPFGFHLTVVLLHILNTVLVFFLSWMILKGYEYRDMGAFISSLIFAVHPIHTESVNWIAGRSDIMAALFFFPSLLFYLKYKEKNQRFWLLLSSLIFFLACMAKEASLSLILLLPVIDITFFSEKTASDEMTRHEKRSSERAEKKKKKGKKKKAEEDLPRKGKTVHKWYHDINILSYLPFIVSAVIYFIVRHFALGGEAKKVLQSGDFFGTLRNIINSYGFYMERLSLPINLNAFIAKVPSGFLTTFFSLVALSILIVAIIYSFLRKKGIIIFSILFFLFTLIPSLMVSIFQIAEIAIAERYLYIPSFSFSFLLGYAFLTIPIKLKESIFKESSQAITIVRFIILFIILALVFLFSLQTIKRNTIWENDLLFWKDVLKKAPDQALPHLNLGWAYAVNKKLEDAEREYKSAIEAKSDDDTRSLIYNNLGSLYLNKGDYKRAEECFKMAISLRSRYALPYYNTALSLWKRYLKTKNTSKKQEDLIERSIEYLKQALRINPQYVKAHNLYGKILLELGHYDEAKKHFETVLRYEKQGKTAQSAKKYLDKLKTHEENKNESYRFSLQDF